MEKRSFQGSFSTSRLAALRTVITEKDARIDKLESQINDLDQNSKKKNIIITALNLHTYATKCLNYRTFYTTLNFNLRVMLKVAK